MYREAETQINEGLGITSRLILGLVAGGFGIMTIWIAPPTEKAIYFYLFGGFCLLITLACITSGRLRQCIGSVIGVSVFAISLWYIYTQLSDNAALVSKRSDPSLVNAILFLLFFGLPGLSYAITSRFGYRHRRPEQTDERTDHPDLHDQDDR